MYQFELINRHCFNAIDYFLDDTFSIIAAIFNFTVTFHIIYQLNPMGANSVVNFFIFHQFYHEDYFIDVVKVLINHLI